MQSFIQKVFMTSALLLVGSAVPERVLANDMALQMLEVFLTDTAQRQAYAQKTAQGQLAEKNLQAFPAYAQKEILKIVMMIMREEKEKASRYKDMDPALAQKTFSPAVRASVKNLSQKLMQDKDFLQNALPVMSGLTH